jgi:hypothetical protein
VTKKRTKRDDVANGIRFAPWVMALDDIDLTSAVVSIASHLRPARMADVDKATAKKLGDEAEALFIIIRKGELRGARARRRADALNSRICKAIDAAKVPCPSCGTNVSPSRLVADTDARRINALIEAEIRRPHVLSASTRALLEKIGEDFARRMSPEDHAEIRREAKAAARSLVASLRASRSSKAKSRASVKGRYVQILTELHRVRVNGSLSVDEESNIAAVLATLWDKLTKAEQREIEELVEQYKREEAMRGLTRGKRGS